jgi:hypothetical protein
VALGFVSILAPSGYSFGNAWHWVPNLWSNLGYWSYAGSVMPFFIFTCQSCKASQKKLLRDEKAAQEYSGACNICGMAIVQTLGTPDGQGYETLDEERGKKSFEGIASLIDERANEHFRKVGAKKMVEEFGEDYVRKQGLIDEDGKAR